MAKRLLFVPITKVDVEKREVWGRAVEETVDKAGEVFDYESSRPLFDAWSEGFSKATDGKSLGNLRAMHGKVAAGKLIAYQPDDAAKAIDIGTKIVDDAEWEKVVEGVYTGFSIGGTYEKRWKDPEHPELTRYTAKPVEISIVDNPCVPTATFTMVKADGAEEQRAFKSVDAEIAEGAVAAPLRKGLWHVGRLASLLTDVQYLAQDSAWEADYEGDGSGVPAQLKGWLAEGVRILTAMVSEEGAEAVASVPSVDAAAPLALAAPTEAEKSERTATAAPAAYTPEQARILAESTAALERAAQVPVPTEPAEKSEPATELAKVDATADEDALAKRLDELLAKRLQEHRDELTKALEKADALAKRVEQLEQQPAPAKGAVRAVTKAEDSGTPASEAEAPKPNRDDPAAVVKAIHARGGQPLVHR